ncbi:putative RAD50-like protein [Operophtera brumata]|uniref:Putative RAD50-like protein n=1 Tax=Operophtera brumata TaxID=104452 RepID=A0A0L7L401_OPEBR|nr:putative RAD50-like protein [Operophtera brumata]
MSFLCIFSFPLFLSVVEAKETRRRIAAVAAAASLSFVLLQFFLHEFSPPFPLIMAGVKSLSVRGIRSFGPEDSDEQRISFDRPLTLILGQNGCGKTTIIECLRYAVTGQMPPGSRNECFVHDAKVNRSTEVLGQVKLKIINAKDKQLEVSRSMKVTALKNKTRFQTLESLLSTIDENGTTKDISSRYSSWPLDEGKKVKERFDEIFDADKYSDCFDRMRKIRKEYANSLNLLAHEVSFLTEKKQDLDKKKLDVVNTETRISEAELKVVELTQELKPVSEKLSAIKVLENDLLSFETKREKIKLHTKIDVYKAIILPILLYATETWCLYKGDTKRLDVFHMKCLRSILRIKWQDRVPNTDILRRTELSGMEALLMQGQLRWCGHLVRMGDTRLPKSVFFSELSQGKHAPGGQFLRYKDILKRSLSSCDIPCDDWEELAHRRSDWRSTVHKATVQYEVTRLEHLDAKRQQQKIKPKTIYIYTYNSFGQLYCPTCDRTFKTKRSWMRVTRRIHLTTKRMTSLLERKTTMKLSTTKMEELTEVSTDEEFEKVFEAITAKINALKQELSEQKAEADVEEKKMQALVDEGRDALSRHKQKISSKDTEIHKNKRELTKLEKEINATNESRTRLEALEKKLSDAETEHQTAEKELNPEECQQEITDDEKAIDQHDKELDELSAKVTKLQKQQAKIQERDMVEGILKQKEKELAVLMNKHKVALTEILGSVPEKEFALSVNKFECDIRSKVDTMKKKLKERQIESTKLETERKHVRDMLNEKRAELSKAEDKMYKACGTQSYDSTLAKHTTAVEKLQDEQNILQSSLFIFAKYKSQLTDNSCCPLCSRGFDNENEKIKACTEAIEELQMSLIEPEQKMQTAKQIHGEMPLLDRNLADTKTILKNLDNLKTLCADIDTEMSLDEATSKQTDLRQKLTTLRSRVKISQKKLNVYNKKLQTIVEPFVSIN